MSYPQRMIEIMSSPYNGALAKRATSKLALLKKMGSMMKGKRG